MGWACVGFFAVLGCAQGLRCRSLLACVEGFWGLRLWSRFWVSGEFAAAVCFGGCAWVWWVRACWGWGFPLACVLVPGLDRWQGGVARLDRGARFSSGVLVPCLDSGKAATACRSAGVCGRGPVVLRVGWLCWGARCWSVLRCLVLGFVLFWLFVGCCLCCRG